MTTTPPTTTRRRVLNYLLQTGRTKLTPTQRRRVMHKSRRSLGRVISGPIELDGIDIDYLADDVLAVSRPLEPFGIGVTAAAEQLVKEVEPK